MRMGNVVTVLRSVALERFCCILELQYSQIRTDHEINDAYSMETSFWVFAQHRCMSALRGVTYGRILFSIVIVFGQCRREREWHQQR